MKIFKGTALVIPPLQTIQLQMAKICDDWNIPYINLLEISKKEDIASIIEEAKPKIILSSIEDISDPIVQNSLQLVNIKYVALDECQVNIHALKSFKIERPFKIPSGSQVTKFFQIS